MRTPDKNSEICFFVAGPLSARVIPLLCLSRDINLFLTPTYLLTYLFAIRLLDVLHCDIATFGRSAFI